eukprot:CAMPEP_0175050602 /NCGR_PEP_ID=MMETSP0052_2-20121109/7346_1 /TAXON_ID=51329 ORGANISM="Polytomella parva, Strain SAG 63-3" /NCGR_SAMPLE_ID=MMETSP0052_2 /ASSEMBLY_ACC=CAM_ASM_000194 /LENGTH=1233 /DNA_ID=CAMNT_0016314815 /DNA_START=53 /DNA_END=3750 /DNA_ORIENTATION=-
MKGWIGYKEIATKLLEKGTQQLQQQKENWNREIFQPKPLQDVSGTLSSQSSLGLFANSSPEERLYLSQLNRTLASLQSQNKSLASEVQSLRSEAEDAPRLRAALNSLKMKVTYSLKGEEAMEALLPNVIADLDKRLLAAAETISSREAALAKSREEADSLRAELSGAECQVSGLQTQILNLASQLKKATQALVESSKGSSKDSSDDAIDNKLEARSSTNLGNQSNIDDDATHCQKEDVAIDNGIQSSLEGEERKDAKQEIALAREEAEKAKIEAERAASEVVHTKQELERAMQQLEATTHAAARAKEESEAAMQMKIQELESSIELLKLELKKRPDSKSVAALQAENDRVQQHVSDLSSSLEQVNLRNLELQQQLQQHKASDEKGGVAGDAVGRRGGEEKGGGGKRETVRRTGKEKKASSSSVVTDDDGSRCERMMIQNPSSSLSLCRSNTETSTLTNGDLNRSDNNSYLSDVSSNSYYNSFSNNSNNNNNNRNNLYLSSLMNSRGSMPNFVRGGSNDSLASNIPGHENLNHYHGSIQGAYGLANTHNHSFSCSTPFSQSPAFLGNIAYSSSLNTSGVDPPASFSLYGYPCFLGQNDSSVGSFPSLFPEASMGEEGEEEGVRFGRQRCVEGGEGGVAKGAKEGERQGVEGGMEGEGTQTRREEGEKGGKRGSGTEEWQERQDGQSAGEVLEGMEDGEGKRTRNSLVNSLPSTNDADSFTCDSRSSKLDIDRKPNHDDDDGDGDGDGGEDDGKQDNEHRVDNIQDMIMNLTLSNSVEVESSATCSTTCLTYTMTSTLLSSQSTNCNCFTTSTSVASACTHTNDTSTSASSGSVEATTSPVLANECMANHPRRADDDDEEKQRIVEEKRKVEEKEEEKRQEGSHLYDCNGTHYYKERNDKEAVVDAAMVNGMLQNAPSQPSTTPLHLSGAFSTPSNHLFSSAAAATAAAAGAGTEMEARPVSAEMPFPEDVAKDGDALASHMEDFLSPSLPSPQNAFTLDPSSLSASPSSFPASQGHSSHAMLDSYAVEQRGNGNGSGNGNGNGNGNGSGSGNGNGSGSGNGDDHRDSSNQDSSVGSRPYHVPYDVSPTRACVSNRGLLSYSLDPFAMEPRRSGNGSGNGSGSGTKSETKSEMGALKESEIKTLKESEIRTPKRSEMGGNNGRRNSGEMARSEERKPKTQGAQQELVSVLPSSSSFSSSASFSTSAAPFLSSSSSSSIVISTVSQKSMTPHHPRT